VNRLSNFLLCGALVGCTADVAPEAAPATSDPQPAAQAPDERPNVLVILADDAGLEAFGCTGAEDVSTPNIDRLAAEGLLFTNAFSQPLCTPSRVKLLTGQSNLRNYVHFSILKPGERTFAHMARDVGYATGIAGKWQLYGAEHNGNWAFQGQRPEESGFDRWCLWQVETLGNRYWGPSLEIDGELEVFDEALYGPDLCVDWLLEFMTAERDGPFLAYYPSCLPHSPYRRTPHSPEDASGKRTHFIAMVEYLDHLVGRLRAGLEEAGLSENTWIVFTSDNGTDDALALTFAGEEFQGGKSHSTDAGTRVPLVVWGAPLAEPGRISDDLVDFSDLYPTLRDWCASEEASALDGRSFAPQAAGLPGEPREVLSMYSNPRPPGTARNPRIRFARDARYKLYDDGRFFDLLEDPREQHPLPEAPERTAVWSRLDSGLYRMPAEPLHLGWRNQSPGAVLGELAKPVAPPEPGESPSDG
jgi:arylsulfatase A-like enzyme